MFVEDFTAFLSEAEFSVPATLPGGAVVQVIFDNAGSTGLGAGMFEASEPIATGPTAALAPLGHGSQLIVAGESWCVAGIMPDGTGITRLILERAP